MQWSTYCCDPAFHFGFAPYLGIFNTDALRSEAPVLPWDYVVVLSLLTLHVFNGRVAGSFEWVKGIATPAGCRYGQPAA